MALRYSQPIITSSDISAVGAVLRSSWLTTGPKVPEFEEALAEYVGAKCAVAVSSGTAALHLALWAALDRPSTVCVPAMSFVATANAVLLAGHEPSFLDVSPTDGNLESYTLECDALVPVHMAGRPCKLPAFHGLPPVTIEDACHALGSMDHDRCSRVGSCAHSLATCFSFHAVKPITTGEGGAVTTNDDALAREVRSLRDHGRDGGLMVRLGGNYRMTDVQAALGISQLRACEAMRLRRVELARMYRSGIASWFGRDQAEVEADHTSMHLLPVRIVGDRDEVLGRLRAAGIGAQVHYSPPIPLHPFYRARGGFKEGDFPGAERWAAEELSLPLHAGMSRWDVRRVLRELRKVLII